VLGLFCDLTLAAGLGASVGDIGCETGRLGPYLAARGLSPQGVDLSAEMTRVARRDHPGFGIADLRALPFEDASLTGVVCWYSLMFLKAGDSRVRRGGRTTGLGVEFDVYWLSPDEMERRVGDAGFATVILGGRPAEGQEGSPQGYLLARKS
jgi:hypothetical protein